MEINTEQRIAIAAEALSKGCVQTAICALNAISESQKPLMVSGQCRWCGWSFEAETRAMKGAFVEMHESGHLAERSAIREWLLLKEVR